MEYEAYNIKPYIKKETTMCTILFYLIAFIVIVNVVAWLGVVAFGIRYSGSIFSWMIEKLLE
jgi:hypothetical protein